MEEQWKDIPEYEGLYQASTFGQIRTCEGKTRASNLEWCSLKENIRKGMENGLYPFKLKSF